MPEHGSKIHGSRNIIAEQESQLVVAVLKTKMLIALAVSPMIITKMRSATSFSKFQL